MLINRVMCGRAASRWLLLWAGCFWLGLATADAFAQAPAITSLLPAGGQRGTTVEVDLIGKPGATPLHPMCILAGQPELTPPDTNAESEPETAPIPLQLTVSEKGDKLTVVIAEQASPGIYWIRLTNSAGANTLLPFHVGLLPEAEEKEPNDSIAEAKKIWKLPLVVNGILKKAGEIDLFPVSLKAGQTLVASLDSHRSLGSPLDGALQISDQNGFVLLDNDDDHGFDPLLTWTAPRDGVYYVRVFGFPAAPSSTINYAGGVDYVYRLTLTTGPFVAYALRTDSVADSDQAGNWLVAGWNLTEAERANPLTAPGLHWLQPAIRRDQTVLPLVKAGAEQSARTVPVQQFGVLDTVDARSETRVTRKKGENVRVRVLARQLDSLLDPVLVIKEQDKVLREVDDIARFELDVATTWKAPSAGEFTFAVQDRYGHAGPRYFHVLEIEPDLARVECQIEAENFVGKKGAALEIPITINRLNNFAEAVTFEVTGLTDQQTAKPVVSEAKGDSAKKVTLKITQNGAEPFQGPIQIIARWGDADDQQLLITRPLKLADYSTSEFWLTLPAAK